MAGSKQQPAQAASKGEQAPSSAGKEGQRAGTWFQVAPLLLAHSLCAALLGLIDRCTEAQCFSTPLLTVMMSMLSMPGACQTAHLCRLCLCVSFKSCPENQ